MTTKTKPAPATPDADVSPMEAQNEGPAHKDVAKEPLPQAKRTDDAKTKSPIRKGGEGESRDDL